MSIGGFRSSVYHYISFFNPSATYMKTFSAVLNQIKVVVYRLCLLKIILTSSSKDGSAMVYCSCLKCMSKRYLRYHCV